MKIKCCVEDCETMGHPTETYGFKVFICTPCLLKLSATCDTATLEHLIEVEPAGGVQ